MFEKGVLLVRSFGNGMVLFLTCCLLFFSPEVFATENGPVGSSSAGHESGVQPLSLLYENPTDAEDPSKTLPRYDSGPGDNVGLAGSGAMDFTSANILVYPPLSDKPFQMIIQDHMQLEQAWGVEIHNGIDDPYCYVHFGIDITTSLRLSNPFSNPLPLYTCSAGSWKGYKLLGSYEYLSRWECTPNDDHFLTVKYVHVKFNHDQIAGGSLPAGHMLPECELGDYFDDLKGDHLHVEVIDACGPYIFNPLTMDSHAFLPSSDMYRPERFGGPYWAFEEYPPDAPKGWKIYVDDKILGTATVNGTPYIITMTRGFERMLPKYFDFTNRNYHLGKWYKHTDPNNPTFTSDSLPNILNPSQFNTVYAQTLQHPHRQYMYVPDSEVANPDTRYETLLVYDNAGNGVQFEYDGGGTPVYAPPDPTPIEAFGFPVTPPGYEGQLIENHPVLSAAAAIR